MTQRIILHHRYDGFTESSGGSATVVEINARQVGWEAGRRVYEPVDPTRPASVDARGSDCIVSLRDLRMPRIDLRPMRHWSESWTWVARTASWREACVYCLGARPECCPPGDRLCGPTGCDPDACCQGACREREEADRHTQGHSEDCHE